MMKAISNSFFIGLLKKLELQDSPNTLNLVKKSFIVEKVINLFKNFQSKFSDVLRGSILFSHIDDIWLVLISLMLISLTFCSTTVIGILVFSCFMIFLLKLLFTKGETHHFSSLDIAVFLFLIVTGISVTFSTFFLASLKGYLKMLVFLVCYLTFINFFKNSSKKLIYLLVLLTISATAESFVAIFQQIVGVEDLALWQDRTQINPEQVMNRVYGTLKPYNPNLLAGYLIPSFAIALGFSFLMLAKKKIYPFILSSVSSFIILMALIFTGCRGGFIAISAMSLSIFAISGHLIFNDLKEQYQLKRIWLTTVIFSIVSVFLFILNSPSLQHRIVSMFAFREDSSISYRMNVYSACITMFTDNWVIGIGPGNTTFRLVYGLYMIPGFHALGAYSVPLEVAVETGILGFIAFLFLLFNIFIKSAKYIINNHNLQNKIIIATAFTGIIGLMSHGLVDTIWYRPQVNILFWLFVAIIAVVTSKENFNKNA